MNRRQFLSSAGAVGLFSIVAPRAVRGTEANGRISVGIVGLGGRGRLIGKLLAEHGGFEIRAVADYFESVSREVGAGLGVEQRYRFSGLLGYKRLIASGVKAVFLETPPCFFPEHCKAAVDAGCHVYMAKPVAVDVPGCLEVAAAAEKAKERKQVFLVDFQTRTDPYNIEAVKRCQTGLIGKVGLLSSLYTDEGFPDPPKTETIESRLQRLIWVNDIAIGGGLLVNAGIHAVDLALWIAGARPVSAMGCGRTVRHQAHGDTCDVYSVTYQFADGRILNHRGEHLRNTHGFLCKCFAYGQHGYMETGYQGRTWIRGNRGGYRGGEVKDLYVEGIRRNLRSFHESITTGNYENPTVQPSIDSTLATILGREAARRNTQITWDQMIQENKRIEVDLRGLKQ